MYYSLKFSEDDARLLLGIHYHGFGNWENIRLDEKLGLTKKIAPVELQHHETFLPRAPQLKERASQLLEMVQYFTTIFISFLVAEMGSLSYVHLSTTIVCIRGRANNFGALCHILKSHQDFTLCKLFIFFI